MTDLADLETIIERGSGVVVVEGVIKAEDDNTNLAQKKLELNQRRLSRLKALREDEEIFGTTSQSVAKLVVECPKCGQQLGATRFALHYERCLNKGSRARANSATLSASAGGRSVSPTGSTEKLQGWSAGCSTCHTTESAESMLLCDGCSRVFHLWCLVPRLNEVPPGMWMCRRCSQRLVALSEPTAKRKKPDQKLNAIDKVKRGRVAAGFDIVEFVCDICNTVIPPTETRFRCLTCGEFDVCANCRQKNGHGHRANHEMAELKLA